MTLAYLQPDIARIKAIGRGLYSNDSAPDDNALIPVLEAIEEEIDDWIGYRAAPTDLIYYGFTDRYGWILLPEYPVIDVSEIMLAGAVYPNSNPPSLDPIEIIAAWQRDQRILTGWRNELCKVSYKAGFDPIPRAFNVAAFELYAAMLSSASNNINSGSSAATIDTGIVTTESDGQSIKRIQIGNLVQEFFPDENGSSSGNNSETKRDEIFRLAGLNRYKRTVMV